MKEEYENKLSEDFTFIDSNMFIETGDGWFQLIYDLCKEIEAVYKREGIVANIIVDAIYEKYGVLHFDFFFEKNSLEYFSYEEEIIKLVNDYEDRSETICEECGNIGILRDVNGWLSVSCDKCNSTRDIIRREFFIIDNILNKDRTVRQDYKHIQWIGHMVYLIAPLENYMNCVGQKIKLMDAEVDYTEFYVKTSEVVSFQIIDDYVRIETSNSIYMLKKI